MEVKQEITQLLEALPSEVLGDVLTYLRQVEKTAPAKRYLTLNLQAILLEDREVLEKLAK